MPESPYRFGWVLHKPDDTTDSQLFNPPMSAASISEFEAVTEVIRFLQPLATSFAICDRAHSSLQALVPAQESWLNASTVGEVSTTRVLDLLLETSAGIVTFLASASALLGHLQGELKRRWGGSSTEYVGWNEFRKARHAGSLGYRLMYELRNFSQHHGLPLSEVGITGVRSGSDGRMAFTCRPTLNRDALLATSFNWGGRRAELQSSPLLIDVLPLIAEYFDCLRAIVHEAVLSFQDNLSECSQYLSVLRKLFAPPADATLVIFHGEPTSATTPPGNVTIVPEQQFRWMLAILQRSAPGP